MTSMEMNEDQEKASEPWVDPDDVPELTEEWFRQADLYEGGKLFAGVGVQKMEPQQRLFTIASSAASL